MPVDWTHQYVYVLTDEIVPAYKTELKGVFKKRQVSTEYKNTIELIHNGIRKYDEKYVGTYDRFWFNLSEPLAVLSKTSYDELVRIWDWRKEVELKEDFEGQFDFDNTMIGGKRIGKKSLWQKKDSHIRSELTVIYSDWDGSRVVGPHPKHIGPGGRPFGDLKIRLKYDFLLNLIVSVASHTNEKKRKKLSNTIEEFFSMYEDEIPSISELKQIHEYVMNPDAVNPKILPNSSPVQNDNNISAKPFDPLSKGASLKFTSEINMLVSGMSFSFVITPQEPDGPNQMYESTGLQPNTEYSLQPSDIAKNVFFDTLLNQSGILEYFSDPVFYYEYEKESTTMIIRFFESSLAGQIDDPVYNEIRQKYSTFVTAQFSGTGHSCRLLESGVIVKQSGTRAIYYFDKDGKLDPEVINAMKQTLLEDQRRDTEKANLLNQGVAFEDQGKYEEALQCYEKALMLDPDDTNPVLLKGSALANMGREKESMACFDSLLNSDPNDHVTILNKGVALEALGKPDEAMMCYDRALEIKPGYDKAYFNKGTTYYHHGKFHEAKELFEKALSITPDYEKAIVWNNYASIMDMLPSENSLSDSREVKCPKCSATVQLTALLDYKIDEKNPLDRYAMNNTDDMVYPKMHHNVYKDLKHLNDDVYIAQIARVESHGDQSSCTLSDKICKVLHYVFIDHENKTAGTTFRIIDTIPRARHPETASPPL